MYYLYLNDMSKEKKQVAFLFAATIFGVFFGVLCSIINTRFLNPRDYGDVRYVQNIIQFVASLLLFGYFLSGSRMLALSKDEFRSRIIRGVMVLILLAASFVLALSMVICYFINSNSNPTVAYLFLISIPVCFYPLLLNYINTVAQGDNHIGRLAISRSVPQLLYVPIAYWFYCSFGATSSRMILLQWGLYCLILICVIVSTHPKIDKIKSIFKELSMENKSYGIQLYIGSLVMVATNYLAGITLGMFNEDNTEVGFYTLALTVTSPLSMLPATIGTTYFKQFASLPRIPAHVMKASITLTIISCVLFIIFIKPIVVYLYSEEYAKVGTYAMWLSVGFSLHGFGDMINRYLGSHGQGTSIRKSSIVNGFFKIVGFTLLVYIWNTEGAIITNILCSSIYTAFLLYYYNSFIKSERV